MLSWAPNRLAAIATASTKSLPRAIAAILRLVGLAVAVGAALAVVTKVIFQAVLWIIGAVWDSVPEWLGVDGSGLWYSLAILSVGGVLVGLGNRFLGDYPQPLEVVTEAVKAGEPIQHRTIPASLGNSVASLGFGGPLGPEALLVSVVGGLYFWADQRMQGLAGKAFAALTGRTSQDVNKPWQYAPMVFAGIAVVVVFRALPGGLDLSFVPEPDAPLGAAAVALSAGAGLVAGAVGVGTSVLHERVRGLKLFHRSPELVGLAGGVVVALLASGSSLVLFSGAEEVSVLFDGSQGTGEIAYAALAKWAGLALVLACGWKGGPIFPLMFCAGALAVASGDTWGVDSVVLYAASISGIVAGALGSMALGVLVALLVVPASLLVPLITGAAAAGFTLRLRSLRAR